jgi:sugar phosphate isomerase/epimerase
MRVLGTFLKGDEMRFSIFTVMLPEWDVATAITKLAAYGYDGVEWRVTNTRKEVKNDAPSYWGRNLCTVELDTILENAARVYKMTKQAGLKTAALAGYHRVDDFDATKVMLEAAKIMKAPLIRVGTPRWDGKSKYDALFKATRAQYQKTAKLAEKAGVKTCLETHMGIITPSASSARRLFEGINPKAVGVIYDPGNMVTEGYEETKMGLEILGPYLAHVHCKNGAWVKKTDAKPGENPWTSGFATPVNEGIVDWRKVLAALKEVGYKGYISFEDFSSARTTEEKVKFNIEYIKSIL